MEADAKEGISTSNTESSSHTDSSSMSTVCVGTQQGKPQGCHTPASMTTQEAQHDVQEQVTKHSSSSPTGQSKALRVAI
eukprot:1090256-Amphidinium_carterae.1